MSDWKTYKLGEIYDFSSGLSKGKEYFGTGYDFVSFKDVFENIFLPKHLNSRVESTETERKACSVLKGDVFLTRTSETYTELGLSSIALQDYPNATFNGFTKRLRPKDIKLIVPEYAGYYFRSPKFRKIVTQFASITTRASLNNEILSNLTIDIPDEKTQIEIGEILKSLDDKIELNYQMNQTLEAIAQTIFKEWFANFNFPGFDGELVDGLPKEWRKGKIEDLFILQRGFDLPATHRTTGEYPVVAASGISSYHDNFKIIGPGVTTGRSGVIGNVFYIHENFWPLNTSLFIKEYKNATPLYAFHVLKAIGLQQLNGGSAVPTLNRNDVHSLECIVPDFTIINLFEEIAKIFFKRKFANEEQISTLIQLRDILLPKLMSGKIEIKA